MFHRSFPNVDTEDSKVDQLVSSAILSTLSRVLRKIDVKKEAERM